MALTARSSRYLWSSKRRFGRRCFGSCRLYRPCKFPSHDPPRRLHSPPPRCKCGRRMPREPCRSPSWPEVGSLRVASLCTGGTPSSMAEEGRMGSRTVATFWGGETCRSSLLWERNQFKRTKCFEGSSSPFVLMIHSVLVFKQPKDARKPTHVLIPPDV